MRGLVRTVVAVVTVLALAEPAGAAEVTSLSAAVEEGSVRLQGFADFTGDPAIGNANPTQVFTDPPLDGEVLVEATPPYQDLRAGYIAEKLTALEFTWQVEDLPDPPLGTPLVLHLYWELTIDGVAYQINVQFDTRGRPLGFLNHNCTTSASIVSCEEVPDAEVTVTLDAVEDTVTASVRRADLRNQNGVSVAKDGARLREADLFAGIAAFTGLGLVPGATSDEANMSRAYVLGRHVESALVPRGTSDADAITLLPGEVATVHSGTGAFSVGIPTEGVAPGDYDAVVRACAGGHCGTLRRTPVTL